MQKWLAIQDTFGHINSPPDFAGGPLLVYLCLRIEVYTVGDSDEHVAVGDSVVLGHAHADAVASRVDHGLEVKSEAKRS